MKIKTKPIAVASLSALCALTLFAGAGMLAKKTASAEDVQNTNIATSYFGDNLATSDGKNYELAKKFYNALDDIYKSGDFLDGKTEYDITAKGIVTSDQIKGWVENGDLTVPKAFSAARDAFLTDHPEIFYIDFYKMTISAGRSNGVYSAFIDSGRAANLYYDNGFTTESAVKEAIEKFDDKVNEIVTKIKADQSKDTYSEKDYFFAKEVNRYIAENTKYDYVTYQNKDDENYIAAANVRTAYGGLVEGKAVCGGFSTAYKVVMDKLGVPCITVNGYSNQKNEYGEYQPSSVYHMWNYVFLEAPTVAKSAASTRDAVNGDWYSVDVTWDHSSLNKNKYAVVSGTSDKDIHVTDGVISSSKYELKYPELSAHNYGASSSTDGLQDSVVYEGAGEDDDDGSTLQSVYATVSYNGKSANKLLEEDGLYLCYRYAAHINGKLVWSDWYAFAPMMEYLNIVADTNGYLEDNGVETRFYENTSVYYMQFAVYDEEPDGLTPPIVSGTYPEYNGKTFKYKYTEDKLNEINSVAMGDINVNKAYGTYTAPPYIINSTPTHQVEQVISDGMRDETIKDKVIMAESKAFVIEITYDEPLHKIDENKPITVSFISDHPDAADYARFYPLDDKGTLVELVERPKNSGSTEMVLNTIRFKFAPSLMWKHNREGYFFLIDNVGSAKMVTKIVDGKEVTTTSDKEPNPAYYIFGREYIACPACFNYDGRLWVECCAQPMLADNSDLSATNFLKEDGTTSFSENERSQMMLVAEKASEETENTMLDEIENSDAISVGKEDIKETATFDIALQICNRYPKIPDGSYVKIMLGFPDGYGPDQAGVKFKLFHRKHDPKTNTYEIEEIPCVVTQFGIVATVKSFSPYMVAAVDADKVKDKTVYATIDGKGGKLSAADGEIKSLKAGESYTYTIKPDDGYQVYAVTLNGKNVTSQVKDGKLTVTYEGLESDNEIEIMYIADEAVKRVVDNNIVTPVKIVTDGETTTKVGEIIDTPDYLQIKTDNNGDNSNVVAIIVVVAAVVIILALAAVAIVLIVKKKNADY